MALSFAAEHAVDIVPHAFGRDAQAAGKLLGQQLFAALQNVLVGAGQALSGGGQRLAANQPVVLKLGDKFCLASEKECFIVTGKGGV